MVKALQYQQGVLRHYYNIIYGKVYSLLNYNLHSATVDTYWVTKSHNKVVIARATFIYTHVGIRHSTDMCPWALHDYRANNLSVALGTHAITITCGMMLYNLPVS